MIISCFIEFEANIYQINILKVFIDASFFCEYTKLSLTHVLLRTVFHMLNKRTFFINPLILKGIIQNLYEKVTEIKKEFIPDELFGHAKKLSEHI